MGNCCSESSIEVVETYQARCKAEERRVKSFQPPAASDIDPEYLFTALKEGYTLATVYHYLTNIDQNTKLSLMRFRHKLPANRSRLTPEREVNLIQFICCMTHFWDIDSTVELLKYFLEWKVVDLESRSFKQREAWQIEPTPTTTAQGEDDAQQQQLQQQHQQNGHTALELCCMGFEASDGKKWRFIEPLIAAGANPSALSHEGKLPVYIAFVEGGSMYDDTYKRAEVLLKLKKSSSGRPVHGLDQPSLVDPKWSLLHKIAKTTKTDAYYTGSLKKWHDILELSLENGASLEVVDENGRSPLEVAEASHNEPAIEIFHKHVAKRKDIS